MYKKNVKTQNIIDKSRNNLINKNNAFGLNTTK